MKCMASMGAHVGKCIIVSFVIHYGGLAHLLWLQWGCANRRLHSQKADIDMLTLTRPPGFNPTFTLIPLTQTLAGPL